ncbi:MAG TPA: alpha/beta fold hydrolase [Candidatus Rubrimentiphilum sp.]|nr:alpha/beta fold hydrolase [Candidatus Rubrimentiphilum sp.]
MRRTGTVQAFFILAILCGWVTPAFASLPRHGLLGTAVAMQNGRVVVSAIVPGSSAEAAGVQKGDVIQSVDGTTVSTVEDFLSKVRRPGGTPVTLTLERGTHPVTLTIVMRSAPDENFLDVQTSYQSVTIDGTLRRTLVTSPIGARGKLPAVFMIGGIGCFSMDTTNTQDGYRNVAHDLSVLGFVVMRLEKSGVGDSQGPPCASVDFNTEYHSYEIAYAAFLQNPLVDPARVYIFGHSIGTVVAPRLALEFPTAGVIVADGVAVNWFEYELINLQRQEILSGSTPFQVDESVAKKEYCMHRLLIEKASPEQILAVRPDCKDYIQYPAPPAYMQQVAALNIAEAWMSVHVPVLALYGQADFVTAESDHKRIVDIVNSHQPNSATLKIIPDMNHYLQIAASQTAAIKQLTDNTPGAYNKRFSGELAAWLCRRERCPALSNN